MMRLGIMQPYFLPYIGYFQLIAAVDRFVVYDNIKYTKKGWINRNRLLVDGGDATFSVALKKDSDSLAIVERSLAAEFSRTKLLNQFKGAYRSAPQFEPAFELLRNIVLSPDSNLFDYLLHSIRLVSEYLEIRTPVLVSSGVEADHAASGEQRVLSICSALNADTYINTIGGLELYSPRRFAEHGIDLKFIKALPLTYSQFGGEFVPWLSIVDVIMFNTVHEIKEKFLPNFELI